jgi:hypothetical protein
MAKPFERRLSLLKEGEAGYHTSHGTSWAFLAENNIYFLVPPPQKH